MVSKEATARIKINKLLEAAGWRFFPEGSAPANIRLEPNVTIKSSDLEALGENFYGHDVGETEAGRGSFQSGRRPTGSRRITSCNWKDIRWTLS